MGNQWCFDVQWCPRNPQCISACSFDGRVSVYSIMGGEMTMQTMAATNKVSYILYWHKKWLLSICICFQSLCWFHQLFGFTLTVYLLWILINIYVSSIMVCVTKIHVGPLIDLICFYNCLVPGKRLSCYIQLLITLLPYTLLALKYYKVSVLSCLSVCSFVVHIWFKLV